MKKVICILSAFLFTLIELFFAQSCSCVSVMNCDFASIGVDVSARDFIEVKDKNKSEEVYLGGYPVGLTIDGDGVTVVGLNEFVDDAGNLSCPAMDAGIQINDVIIELDGVKIFNSSRLADIASRSHGNKLTIKYMRDGVVYQNVIIPKVDLSSNCRRLGLWTRDSSSGIGTLTYIRKDLSFGCLGHPICDGKGNVVRCDNGGVFSCSIDGVQKGKKGEAGELKGSFGFDKKLGTLGSNGKFGVFGEFSKLPSYCNELIPVADVTEVVPGKATIMCTVDGKRDEYDIEIVKVSHQRYPDDKGMVVHVTDERLLEKTGGIVQGMSGSPIVQNGKLVGAVTHVFVNDPTRGYGIFAAWMLANG